MYSTIHCCHCETDFEMEYGIQGIKMHKLISMEKIENYNLDLTCPYCGNRIFGVLVKEDDKSQIMGVSDALYGTYTKSTITDPIPQNKRL